MQIRLDAAHGERIDRRISVADPVPEVGFGASTVAGPATLLRIVRRIPGRLLLGMSRALEVLASIFEALGSVTDVELETT